MRMWSRAAASRNSVSCSTHTCANASAPPRNNQTAIAASAGVSAVNGGVTDGPSSAIRMSSARRANHVLALSSPRRRSCASPYVRLELMRLWIPRPSRARTSSARSHAATHAAIVSRHPLHVHKKSAICRAPSGSARMNRSTAPDPRAAPHVSRGSKWVSVQLDHSIAHARFVRPSYCCAAVGNRNTCTPPQASRRTCRHCARAASTVACPSVLVEPWITAAGRVGRAIAHEPMHGDVALVRRDPASRWWHASGLLS